MTTLTEDIDVTLGVGPESLSIVRDVCSALGLELFPQGGDPPAP